jgi:hypothetical protein
LPHLSRLRQKNRFLLLTSPHDTCVSSGLTSWSAMGPHARRATGTTWKGTRSAQRA